MSCNGCRVLRKGCSESCILRPCLQWIETAEAQGHATVFVAKFFGRAGLMSFISAVPEQQRPALFQSLLFEACGRTVNPVNGAVGLLGTGNWHVCQTAVETVLRGGTLRPLSEIPSVVLMPESDETSVVEEQSTYGVEKLQDPYGRSKCFSKRNGFHEDLVISQPFSLDLSLTSDFPAKNQAVGAHRPENRRPATPSFNSEGSVTTCFESAGDQISGDRKLLNLFF